MNTYKAQLKAAKIQKAADAWAAEEKLYGRPGYYDRLRNLFLAYMKESGLTEDGAHRALRPGTYW